MGAREFGQIVSDRMDELDWSQNKVARRFGELPDGRGLDSTQVRLIKEGQRRLDHALVERLIQVLGLDEDPAVELKAWEAAGLWPPGYSIGDVSDLSERLTTRRMAAQAGSPRGGQDAATGPPTDQPIPHKDRSEQASERESAWAA